MEPIAIVGMSCLFPDADSPAKFWENLLGEKSGIRDVEDDDFPRSVLHAYSPSIGKPDTFYYKKSGLIRDFHFQADGFAVEKAELNCLDDLHRWVLHTAREALRDAGLSTPIFKGPTCGLLLANLSLPTARSYDYFAPHYLRKIESFFQRACGKSALRFDPAAFHPPAHPMAAPVSGYPSAVAQKAMALQGPCYTLDAACASVLYTVRLASYYLQLGMADVMLAGAVCKPDYLSAACGFSVLRAFPAAGSSQPLDQNSKGITFSEGAGMFALKRLKDAVRDQDRVYALVEGVGLSNDGAGMPLLTPNPKGQILAMEAAYRESGISPREIDYIECHATGTPVGDRTELNSLEQMFGKDGPLVGGNKANLGHMLTASGAAGLLKVVLGMQHEVIPATLHVSAPLESARKTVQSDRMVLRRKRWPGQEKTKKAALNGFGFGGSNAHMILSQGDESIKQRCLDANPVPISLSPMAVIGLGIHMGNHSTLSEFRDSIYFGNGEKKTSLSRRGMDQNGTLIEHYEFDFLHYKIPPHKTDTPQHQSLLMFKTADEAILDSGWRPDRCRNVAVVIAMEMDESIHRMVLRQNLDYYLRTEFTKAGIRFDEPAFQALTENLKDAFTVPASSERITSFIGNTVAARIASAWDFTGPAFTVSAGDNSSLRALQVAQCLLAFEAVEAVVVGSVDLGGSLERTVWRREWARHHGQEIEGFRAAEGAGAVVLARRDEARMSAQRVYAEIEAIYIQPNRVTYNNSPSASFSEDGSRAVREAIRLSGGDTTDCGYVEIAGNKMGADTDEWFSALSPIHSASGNPMALGSLQEDWGDGFAARGLFSLIKTALCLHHRFLPISLHKGPSPLGDDFYRPPFSRPWLHDPQSPRKALICNMGMDDTISVAVVRESSRKPTERIWQDAPPHKTYMLLLKATSPDGIASALENMESRLASGEAIHSLADECYRAWAPKADAEGCALALLAASAEELKREATAAKANLTRSAESGQEWVSSAGSCFVPRPFQEGKVAFVYPMAGGLTVGTGADLPYFFPSLWEDLSGINTYNNSYINRNLVYPFKQVNDHPKSGQSHEIELGRDRLTYFGYSTLFAFMATRLLRNTFGVAPQTALGCSIGELGMLYSFRTLYNPIDETDDRAFYELLRSIKPTLYENDTLQSYFKEEKIEWKSYYVSGSIDLLAQRLSEESRVFLAVQGSPRDAIVSGHQADAERIFKEISCYYTESKDFGFVHTPLATPADTIIRDFLLNQENLKVRQESAVAFLSATAPYQYELTMESVAHHMASVMASPIHFNQIVEKAYETGIRIFIDIGPGSLSARWIQETLRGLPVSIVSLHTKGSEEDRGVLSVLARLAAHRIPVDLSSLYREEKKAVRNRFIKTLSINDSDIDAQLNSDQRLSQAQAIVASSLPFASEINAKGRNVDEAAILQSPAVGVEYQPMDIFSLNDTASNHSSSFARGCQMQTLYLQVQNAFMVNVEKSLKNNSGSFQSEEYISDPKESSYFTTPIPLVKKKALWDYAEILEWNEGRVSRVLGAEYAKVDSYPIRARMPSPPFLFVSRITDLQAKRGGLEPCFIEWEYDIPFHDWFADGTNLQGLVPLESSHASIFLFGYIGLDERFGGRNTYRAIGSETVLKGDLPKPGDTLKGRVDIRSFVQRNEQILTFFDYECRIGNRLVLTTSITGGFFPISESKETKGILRLSPRKPNDSFKSIQTLTPLSRKKLFTQEDLIRFIQGNHAECFGESYLTHPYFFVCTPNSLMLDRVRAIHIQDGSSGLGYAVAEKDIDPNHWIFDAHFKNDPILPGSLMMEGAYQLLIFFMCYLRLNEGIANCRFYYLPEIKETTRFRGPVLREKGVLEYRLHVREIHLNPHPRVIADAEILHKGKTIATRENFGVGFIGQE